MRARPWALHHIFIHAAVALREGLYAKVRFSLNLALNHRKLEAFKTKEMFHGIRPLMFLLIGSGLRVSDTTWCPGPY